MLLNQLPEFIVLCGKTGSGKTLVLQNLSLRNLPVIDIEMLASHRGSVFGNVQLPEPPSQHVFEDLIYQQLYLHQYTPYVFIENKPARLGKLTLPDWLLQKMNNGHCIRLVVSKDDRIANLLAVYIKENKKALSVALQKLSGRISTADMYTIQQSLDEEDYPLFIGKLLDYYDQSGFYNEQKKLLATVDIKPFDAAMAADKIIDILRQKDNSF